MEKLIIQPIWFDSLGAKSLCTVVKTPDVNVLTITELSFSPLTVKYPEGKSFKFGNTTLRFSKPLFHGIEFSRVGWHFRKLKDSTKPKLRVLTRESI